ncbi:DUF2391 family protein [Halohasta litorea]|uniref:DUF2391 family protein n=1 Tax=Halohasta litorea TaxID=869891 RepID=A0ABD6D298_9EURY|nr:DUF2391 family protein [Halohasta litorea]
MGRDDSSREGDVELQEVLSQLDELEGTIETPEQHRELQETKHLIERLPGGEFLDDQIDKYTTRDLGEAFVGSIIFALPLLVEDGVFVIADHFLTVLVAGVPVYLVAHVLFVITLTTGLIYAVDFREVRIVNPIFGLVPRRLVGVLLISFLTSAGLMVLWGRMDIGDPTTAAVFARITVVWAAAALGASLGDILPGESKGTDLTLGNLDELIETNDGTARR